MDTLQEREDTIIRNIFSGNNRCGTLQSAVTNHDDQYFRHAVRPALAVYEDEAEYARRQRDTLLRQSEKRRQALEFVASNLPLSGEIAKVVGEALERPL